MVAPRPGGARSRRAAAPRVRVHGGERAPELPFTGAPGRVVTRARAPSQATPPRAAILSSETSSWLVAAAQDGDRAAQGELFRRHQQRVARIVLRVARDASIVDDLVQDVFIRALNSLQRFRSESRVETWLHVIAVNVARTWLDGERRRKRRAQLAIRRCGESATPEDFVAHQEHHTRLRAALGALPRKYRDAFLARVIRGLSLREASAALGVGVSTVSFRALRAEQLLCAALGLEWSPPRARRQPAREC